MFFAWFPPKLFNETALTIGSGHLGLSSKFLLIPNYYFLFTNKKTNMAQFTCFVFNFVTSFVEAYSKYA